MMASALTRVLTASLCGSLLTACATSHVMVGTQRAPISAEDVRVYLDPPESFEKIALLESSSQGSIAITSQGKINAVVSRLKKEAASLGANGVLLTSMGNASRGGVITTSGASYGTGFVGTGVAIPAMVKEGGAIAIYVPADASQPPAPSTSPSGPASPAAAPADDCEACGRIRKGG